MERRRGRSKREEEEEEEIEEKEKGVSVRALVFFFGLPLGKRRDPPGGGTADIVYVRVTMARWSCVHNG